MAAKYSTVDTLRQQYLFIPAKYKDCYLTYVLTGGYCTGTAGRVPWLASAALCVEPCICSWRDSCAYLSACTQQHPPTLAQLTQPTVVMFPRTAATPAATECLRSFPHPPPPAPPAELAGSTVMMFTRTCDSTRKLALMLRNLGFGAIPIHGQMSQPKRLAALNKFKASGGMGSGGGDMSMVAVVVLLLAVGVLLGSGEVVVGGLWLLWWCWREPTRPPTCSVPHLPTHNNPGDLQRLPHPRPPTHHPTCAGGGAEYPGGH